MRKVFVVAAAALLVGIVAIGTAVAASGDNARVFTADLGGDNQVPPLVSAGSGLGSFALNDAGTELAYQLVANDAVGVTQAHIHLGEADENGPVVAFLFGFDAAGVDADGVLADGVISSADIFSKTAGEDPAGTGFDGSLGALVDRLRSGSAYVNVHTLVNPGGELRGQIGPEVAVNFTADLSGNNQVPPLVSDGTGVGVMSVNNTETQLGYKVLTYNAEAVTQAHIHLGQADENGPVVAFLFGFVAEGVTADGILAQGTITDADIFSKTAGEDPAGTGFDGTLAALLDRLRSGSAYINVHSVANPAGEIRGQIGPLDPPFGQNGTFDDDDGNTHEANIEAIAAAGITNGCSASQFCPRDDLTRGQMAALLFRALNLKPVVGDFFTDDDGRGFETEINAIAALGITNGCEPGLYCPDDPVTRAQMASFLARALGLTAGAGDDLFTDDDGNTHEANIDRLATAGITQGCTANNEYCPDDQVKRDQFASFMARALGLG